MGWDGMGYTVGTGVAMTEAVAQYRNAILDKGVGKNSQIIP